MFKCEVYGVKYNGELVINEEDKKISISIILNILYDK